MLKEKEAQNYLREKRLEELRDQVLLGSIDTCSTYIIFVNLTG